MGKVLLIYTGGTIGMVQDAKTGRLKPFDYHNLNKQIPEINRFDVEIEGVSFEEPIDSSDIDISHWIKMAEIIRDNYSEYDGFVILHGSDTMAFSASALSFMLNNLDKPVIFTGSQLPIGVIRTDGKENLLTSIEIASAKKNGKALVPEVAIYFEYQLYRGNRTHKFSASHFEAFISANYPVLAEAGVDIKYNLQSISNFSNGGDFSINTNLQREVVILSLFPGISQKIIETALNLPDVKVVILRTYGSGNAMTAKWFLNALENAVKRGVHIINVTQCQSGFVDQGKYETSAGFESIGLIGGADLTLEAAVTKAMFLSAQNYDRTSFVKLYKESLRGELSIR